MQRRSFIGSSVMTLLAGPAHARSSARGGATFRMPSRVFARVDGVEIRLARRKTGIYARQGIELRIDDRGPTQTVFVRAPSVLLEEVRLEWQADSPLRILNDHWERTYGDVGWRAPSPTLLLPWYFLEERRTGFSGFGVKTGAAVFAHWRYADQSRHLVLNTRNGGTGVQLGARELHAADIVALDRLSEESSFGFLRRFTKSMCDAPRLSAQPIYGINDWYFAYGKNSDDAIKEHTELMAPMADGLLNRPFSVIDAGWFEPPSNVDGDCCFGGRMDTPNVRFRDMKELAFTIRKLGMRPGIWTRPLCGKLGDDPSHKLPNVAGRNDPRRPILDPTIPEVLERVRGYFRQYREWGYELVKIDFTTFDILGKWGFEMIRDGRITDSSWRMHDTAHTNAEIINQLYSAMREAAGNLTVIGCNTVSHLSAGVFEANRIGDDTSGKEWARTRKMGVNALAFRGAHQGHFYAADADCVGLTTEIPWDKNRQWMDLVARSGTPLFISAQPAAVQASQRAAIREAFRLASEQQPIAEPVDWTESPLPKRWRFGEATQDYNWD